jgi:hypothetical protein
MSSKKLLIHFATFHLRQTRRMLLWGPGRVRLAACVAMLATVTGFGIEAVAQNSAGETIKSSGLRSSPQHNDVIVVGFLGGFVHRDDPYHPEVRLIQELREEYPTGAHFGLFENRNLDEAYRFIMGASSPGNSSARSSDSARLTRILLFGHSWGASAVVRLARKLDRAGIPVALTIQVDSVTKPFTNDSLIPPNVAAAANFFQTHGLIHGRSSITAADPEHTRIVGNFEREYQTEPRACRNFSWYSRLLAKSHIEIECDPNLWTEIKALLEHYLSSEMPASRLDARFGELGPMDGLLPRNNLEGRNR